MFSVISVTVKQADGAKISTLPVCLCFIWILSGFFCCKKLNISTCSNYHYHHYDYLRP